MRGDIVSGGTCFGWSSLRIERVKRSYGVYYYREVWFLMVAMKPQDLGAFIDKDDGGEFTCGSVECKEEPQFLLSQTISDDPQAHVKSLEALHALCGN